MFESFYHEPLRTPDLMVVHEGQGYIPVYDTNNKVIGFESDSRNNMSIPFNLNSIYYVERNASCWPDTELHITEDDYYDPNEYESSDGWKGYKGDVGDRYYDRVYDIEKGQTKHLSWTLVASLRYAKINIWVPDDNLTLPKDGLVEMEFIKNLQGKEVHALVLNFRKIEVKNEKFDTQKFNLDIKSFELKPGTYQIIIYTQDIETEQILIELTFDLTLI